MTRDDEGSPLVDAVKSFDAELQKFTRAAESARRRPLDSKKNIERAVEALKEAAAAEAALESKAREMLAALNASRDRQQAEAEAVRARADEIQERCKVFDELMERYRRIGGDTAALGERASVLMAERKPGQNPTADAELQAVLAELDSRLAQARDDAKGLRADATTAEFEEVSREAHAAEQTLSALRNKVLLLQRALGISKPLPEA